MKAISIVDLDKTLIRVNSFPLWIRFLLTSSARSLNIKRLAKIAIWSLQRKFGTLDHPRFKESVMRLTISEQEVRKFASRLATEIDQTVLNAVVATNAPILVATAAPETYLPALLQELKMPTLGLLASGCYPGRGWVDNSGSEELLSVQNFIASAVKGTPKTTFFTDDASDSPLATWCSETYICNSTDQSYDVLTSAAPRAKYLSNSVLTSEQNRVRSFARLDLSRSCDLAAISSDLYRKAISEFGHFDLVVGIATGGDYVGGAIKLQYNLNYMRVRCHRPSTSTKRGGRLNPLIRKMPDRLKWLLRDLEIRFHERNQNQYPVSSVTRKVELLTPPNAHSSLDRILIVDDSVDSGHTLFAVSEFIRKQFPEAEIVTAAITTSFQKPTFAPNIALVPRALLRGPWSMDTSV